MLIRPFTPADYPVVAQVMAKAYSAADGTPLLPITEEDIREEDADLAPPLKWGRWVAEVDGRVVGIFCCGPQWRVRRRS